MDTNYKTVHFTGIGGISMSALAKILLSNGYKVQGSDKNNSEIIDKLIKDGAKINIGHQKNNIIGADLLVYTDAVSSDNEELVYARELNIPIMNRAEFLGAIMKKYNSRIVISGTHGKTTTTSMIAKILIDSPKNPTILIGGNFDSINGNVRVGSNEIFITEGCEYKGNIKYYNPTICVILNVDSDHLDFFKDLDDVLNAFISYVKKLSSDNHLIINRETYGYDELINATKGKVHSFGKNDDSEYIIRDLIHDEFGRINFTIVNLGKEYPVTLNIMGEHNAYNASASIISAVLSGMEINEAIKKIEGYQGVHRRLEKKGEVCGINIYDDYAHHPTEIQASLSSLKDIKKGKLYAIFQPHTYTRTKALLSHFGESFEDSDEAVITDIYAAREINDNSIHSKDLVNEINKNGKKATYFSSFPEIIDYLKLKAKEDDIILTIGAGNIYELGEMFLKQKGISI